MLCGKDLFIYYIFKYLKDIKMCYVNVMFKYIKSAKYNLLENVYQYSIFRLKHAKFRP